MLAIVGSVAEEQGRVAERQRAERERLQELETQLHRERERQRLVDRDQAMEQGRLAQQRAQTSADYTAQSEGEFG